jgi:hypothetical protein
MTAITVMRPGNVSKAEPFTVLVIANPAIQALKSANVFVRDPVVDDPAAFIACARYIEDALFRRLPGQIEPMLGAPDIVDEIRMLSILEPAMPVDDLHAFVAHDDVSTLLLARRATIAAFLTAQELIADVVYAVSASPSHTRASAWFTSDDDTRGGVPFTLDGVPLSHRFYYTIPGTVALHTSATSLTAAHELQHAISSYTNGQIVDLYVDSPAAVNCRRGRPIAQPFARYQADAHASDPDRANLGYPAGWASFHCDRVDRGRPALMDNYWLGHPPEACQNDTITRQFVLDRVRAKIAR